MENKDNKKSVSNFLKREGFYVILFVCLCIIATVTAITTKNNRKVDKSPKTTQNQKADSNKPDGSVSLSQKDKEINNAVQVKQNENAKKADTGIQASTKKEVSVSKSSQPEFIKPVEGEIVMKYSQTPVWWETSKSYRPNFGINIKANVGTPVKAVANGEVKSVDENGSFGTSVTIYHPESGKATVYGNLDKELKIKKGDKVTQGQEIGKIGKTSLRGMSEEIGNNFLHFEVLKNLKEDSQYSSENPEKYIKY
ncbi:peptidoglycan DD-metalloendopeptidase family protein [Clostridium sp.]|jgi:murein DD-endopeptidase MepM/ murein hydrolase activator NlpD|uniref:peptidoglycan DD-metalloendopeptidase family protein n=1 Tax=Clostridium sp. TaxID=1506 RepID=UPI0039F44BEB